MKKKRKRSNKQKPLNLESKQTAKKHNISEEELSNILSENIVIDEYLKSLSTYKEDLTETDIIPDMDKFSLEFDKIKKQSQEEKRKNIKIKQEKLKKLQESRSPVVAVKLNAASKMDETEQNNVLEQASDIINKAKIEAKNRSNSTKEKSPKKNTNIYSGAPLKKASFFSKFKSIFTIDDSQSLSDDDPWAIYTDDINSNLSSNPIKLPRPIKTMKKTDIDFIKSDNTKSYSSDYTIETKDIIEATTDTNQDEVAIEKEPAKKIITKKVIKYKKKKRNNTKNKASTNKYSNNVLIIPPRDHKIDTANSLINENDKPLEIDSTDQLENIFDKTLQKDSTLENISQVKNVIDNAVKEINSPENSKSTGEVIKNAADKINYNSNDSKKENPSKNKKNHNKNVLPNDYKAILKLAGNMYKKQTGSKIAVFSGNLEENLIEECKASFKTSNLNKNVKPASNKNPSKKKIVKQDLEEIADYNNINEANSIKSDILKTYRKLLLRSIITFSLFIISFILVSFYQISVPIISNMLLEHNLVYIIINLLCLLVSAILCKTTIINGLNSIFKFKGNSDSAIAFACIASIIQASIALIFPNNFEKLGYSLYAVLALLGLFLNSLGKFKVIKRIQLNFNFLLSDEQKYAAKILTDENKLNQLPNSFKNYEPIVAYQKRTEFLSDFLKLSYEPDPVEKTMGKASLITTLVSITAFIISLILTNQIVTSFSILALISCMAVPMTCILAINSPMLSLVKKALSRGAMIVGYPAVKQFCDTNILVVDANELYPGDSITLHGIKSFGDISIDNVMLEAGAVLKRANAPLSKTMDKILKNRQDIMPTVINYKYLDDLGIEGFVRGHKVLIGNRRLLELNNICPPKWEIEKKYIKNNRYLTYIAIDNELCAMLILSYKPNEDMMLEMQRLEDNGVSFLITTHDQNITAKMIEKHFKLFFRSIKILKSDQAEFFINSKEHPEIKTRAYLATKGKTVSLARFISACIRLKSNISASIITQTMTIVLGMSLTVFLSFHVGVDNLRSLKMSIYSLFWVFVNILIPRFRKP